MFELPEGLVWSNLYNSFLFVDIKQNSVFSYKNGVVNLINKFNENIGFIFPHDEEDVLICGLESGIYSFSLKTKELEVIQLINKVGYRLNDGFIDHNKILWFGVMCRDERSISKLKKGSLYSFSFQKGLLLEDNDYLIPNGPIISKDKKWLYHSDSMLGIIYKYPYKKQELNAKERKIFFHSYDHSKKMPSPDGMTLDEEGNLFVAMWGIGEVWKIDKDANLLKKFKTKGVNTTNVCFGGEKLKNLLVSYAKSDDLPGGVHPIESHETKGIKLGYYL